MFSEELFHNRRFVLSHHPRRPPHDGGAAVEERSGPQQANTQSREGVELQIRWKLYVCLVVALLLSPSVSAQSLRTLSGTLPELVAELTSSRYFLYGPKSDPRPYLQPDEALSTISQTARMLDHGEVEEAARLADEVDYELVEFIDRETEQRYLLLRENLEKLAEPRGWGSYILNPESDLPALIEAPHPIDDAHSASVAAMVFARGSKALLIAGAQRDKADVPDLINSVFHQVHVAWSGTLGRVATWQIHGFAIEKHPFPENARAILSTGAGDVPGEIVQLKAELASRGLPGYVFNHLEPSAELNIEVNDGTPGFRFRSLAATKNEQGRHVREQGGTFVHVELERSVRTSDQQRQQAAEAIAEAIAASLRGQRLLKNEGVKGEREIKLARRSPGRKQAKASS